MATDEAQSCLFPSIRQTNNVPTAQVADTGPIALFVYFSYSLISLRVHTSPFASQFRIPAFKNVRQRWHQGGVPSPSSPSHATPAEQSHKLDPLRPFVLQSDLSSTARSNISLYLGRRIRSHPVLDKEAMGP
jgi:hypothetical protein